MNSNYYVNKLRIKLKDKKIFIWTATIILFLINYDISSGFFSIKASENLVLNPSKLEAVRIFFGDKINSFNLYSHKNLVVIAMFYYFIALVACKGLAHYLYEFFVKSKTFKPKEVDPADIAVPNFPYDQDTLQLVIGLKHKESKTDLVENPKWITVPQKGLHQDFLISGGKGTGKTMSCMYPFTKQMMYYKAYSPNEKAGMLILDVKGNYTKETIKCAREVNRENDVMVINLSGQYRYNPLHKPSLRPQVIANRLRTILELFSTQHADSFWLDKGEVLLTQSIKLVRLYNEGYVTFNEIHKVVNIDEYLNDKIEYLQELEDRNKLSREERANFRTVKDYFLNEYRTLDNKISSVIKSEVTRMTQTFIDDPDIMKTFCAPKEKLNFFGFDDLVDTGKIVVLDMNIAEFRNLSKIIAAYLKLDFQSSAMMRLTRKDANTTRPLIFISDEYQEYVTASDADFFSVSREAKCVNIVSTQSYSSLLKTLKSEEALQTILTNLTNKIWLRTDDKKTAEIAVNQCGMIKKKEVSKGYNKSGKKNYSNLMGRSFGGGGSSFGENLNISVRSTNKFDMEMFTIKIPTFKGIAYLSDGEKVMSPTVIHLEPYFKEIYTNLYKRARPALNDARSTLRKRAPTMEDEEEIDDNYDFKSESVTEKEKGFGFEEEYSATKEEGQQKKDDMDIDFEFDDDTDDFSIDDNTEQYSITDDSQDSNIDDNDYEIDNINDTDDTDDYDIDELDTNKSDMYSKSKQVNEEVEEDLKKIEGIFDED